MQGINKHTSELNCRIISQGKQQKCNWLNNLKLDWTKHLIIYGSKEACLGRRWIRWLNRSFPSLACIILWFITVDDSMLTMLSLFSYKCLLQDSVCPCHYTFLIIPSYHKGTGGAKQCLCMKYCVSTSVLGPHMWEEWERHLSIP